MLRWRWKSQPLQVVVRMAVRRRPALPPPDQEQMNPPRRLAGSLQAPGLIEPVLLKRGSAWQEQPGPAWESPQVESPQVEPPRMESRLVLPQGVWPEPSQQMHSRLRSRALRWAKSRSTQATPLRVEPGWVFVRVQVLAWMLVWRERQMSKQSGLVARSWRRATCPSGSPVHRRPQTQPDHLRDHRPAWWCCRRHRVRQRCRLTPLDTCSCPRLCTPGY